MRRRRRQSAGATHPGGEDCSDGLGQVVHLRRQKRGKKVSCRGDDPVGNHPRCLPVYNRGQTGQEWRECWRWGGGGITMAVEALRCRRAKVIMLKFSAVQTSTAYASTYSASSGQPPGHHPAGPSAVYGPACGDGGHRHCHRVSTHDHRP